MTYSTLSLLVLTSVTVAAEWCEYPLIEDAKLRASSEFYNREASKAILYMDGAWTAQNADYSQYIEIDLGEMKNVTAFATQGRQFSEEYVTAYTLSSSNDGVIFAQVKGPDGSIWAFAGNSDGTSVVVTRFDTEIVARYLRVNPTRWRDKISMRMQVYGCQYERETLSFRGHSMVEVDLRHAPITSLHDHIRFRMRTNQPDGVLLYGRGSQGDYLALQLIANRLVLNVNLGSVLMTSLSVGSILDDNAWHDVEARRNHNNVTLLVDRVRVDDIIVGDFPRLDLNRKLYIGGVPTKQPGLATHLNYTGCLENFFINGSSLLHAIQNPEPHAKYYGRPTYTTHALTHSCAYGDSVDLTMTFTTAVSHLRYDNAHESDSVNVSLSFRTYEPKGLLMYHEFADQGYFKLFLEDGHVKVEVSAKHTPKRVVLDNFRDAHNDGEWHSVQFGITTNAMKLVVDGVPMHTQRLIEIRGGAEFWIAGGVHGTTGFMGCMRKIAVIGYFQKPKPEQIFGGSDVVLAACQIMDRCTPNPCQHGAPCHQTAREFHCDCTGTGYFGAVCHAAMNPVSCAAYGKQNPNTKKADIFIDVDGSGPLEPFPVTCEFFNDGMTYTHLAHKHEQLTTVDGFDLAGSYVQDIIYDASYNQIEVLVNRSANCRQRLHYECLKAKLFNTPSPESTDFRPSTWWVNRHNQPMDYWAGSLPGSRKCECGLMGTCILSDRWCNCDAGLESWLYDSGDLTIKHDLPVRQIRIGDTGSPLDGRKSRYTVGPLICDGDDVFQNVVTFRLSEATLLLPRYDMGHAGDIYLEFRTTQPDGCLLHARGDEDFIKLSLNGALELQFQYSAGQGQMTVTVSTAYMLNDNEWHSVLLERNRKEARLIVDGRRESAVREPPGTVRAMYLTSDFVVGATADYRDGFVGCLRALMLNGELQDLRGRAESRAVFGVGAGCVGRCASSPCLNNGTCFERYDAYTCECRWTAFKGPICADEIGIKMLTNTMVKYTLPGTFKSTIAESIRVGFTTTNPRGFLMGLYSNLTGEYLTLQISNSGHLRVTFDFGFERHEFVYGERTFHEGQNHDVRLKRIDKGATWWMQVDSYAPMTWTYPVKASDDAQFDNIQYVYVGRNESMGEGFVGCISRVEFDDIYPIKFLFQQDGPTAILAESDSKIIEDYCGIEPIRHPEELQETRADPEVDQAILLSLYDNTVMVLGVVLALLFAAALLLTCVILRHVARHKGDYRTHEADGAEMAPDADDAVLHGKTGHTVTKTQEMYI